MRIVIGSLLRAALLVALALTVAACVAKPSFRCTTDEACVSSDGKKGVCDQTGACDFSKAPTSVLPSGNVDSGEGPCVLDPAGDCYRCVPTTSEQIINACTSATCVPFDDATRLTKLSAGGSLPPLPK